jgi:hypothetical protein
MVCTWFVTNAVTLKGLYMMMTSEEIDYIALAKQAGADYSDDHAVSLLDDEIIIFAKLVAQHERERIKKEQQRCYVARGEAT